jgi:hypothetical protein
MEDNESHHPQCSSIYGCFHKAAISVLAATLDCLDTPCSMQNSTNQKIKAKKTLSFPVKSPLPLHFW